MKVWIMCMVALLTACSQDEYSADATERLRDFRAPMRTLPWLADFRIGAAPADASGLTQLKQEFRPGEQIFLTMRINDVPRGTRVTTCWYGPSGDVLAYETRAVLAGQERLRFRQDETFAWPQGTYRAEIWIGDTKLREQLFEILAAGAVRANENGRPVTQVH